jgi:ABC-type polysaccharide/polyol phosphate export permease
MAGPDLADGLQRWQLWGTLGWADVRQRYSRSVIGPFWITLSLGFMVAGLGVVYAALFHRNIREYLPFLASGIIVWNMISLQLTDGCMIFIQSDATTKQVPFPLSVHVYRALWRNLIIFGHNLIIYVILMAIFRIMPGWPMLLFIPAVAILVMNGFGFALTLGIISARFRDIPQLITNLIQLVFFVTPILWDKSTLDPARAWIVHLNPFSFLVEIGRDSLRGQLVPLSTWGVTLAFTALNLIVACLMYRRFRWRIPYWL